MSHRNFVKVESIGKGTASRVWLVHEDGDPKKEYALKATQVRTKEILKYEDIEPSVSMLRSLKDDNIVKIVDCFLSENEGFQVGILALSRLESTHVKFLRSLLSSWKNAILT